MGNKSGIIYNRSQEDIFFYIHKGDEECPFINIAVKNQLENPDNKTLVNLILDVYGSYQVPAGKIVTAGLDDLKCNGTESISIVSEKGTLMANKNQINDIKDIRIGIREDLTFATIDEDTAKRLMEIDQAKKIAYGRCHICNAMAVEAEPSKKMHCRKCRTKTKAIWSCTQSADKHTFCQRCHDTGMMQEVMTDILNKQILPIK